MCGEYLWTRTVGGVGPHGFRKPEHAREHVADRERWRGCERITSLSHGPHAVGLRGPPVALCHIADVVDRSLVPRTTGKERHAVVIQVLSVAGPDPLELGYELLPEESAGAAVVVVDEVRLGRRDVVFGCAFSVGGGSLGLGRGLRLLLGGPRVLDSPRSKRCPSPPRSHTRSCQRLKPPLVLPEIDERP